MQHYLHEASASTLKPQDVIYYSALRFIIGATYCTHNGLLYIWEGEPPSLKT